MVGSTQQLQDSLSPVRSASQDPEANDRSSSTRAASSQLRAVRFTVTVISASGLPHLKNVFGKERRLYVSATDGATTRTTPSAVQSSRQTAQWNAVLGEFTLNTSSCLTLNVFAERKLHTDELVGALKIQPDSIGASPPRDYDLVLSKDIDGHSSQQPTISLSITLSEAYSPTLIAAINVPEPAPVERQMDDRRQFGDVPAQIGMPVPAGAESSTETPPIPEALRRADDAMKSMQSASSPVVTATSSWEKATDLVSEADDVLETMGTVIHQIKAVMDAVDSIAELHPYAKMAWSVLSCIPKALLAQVERDGNVQALLSAVHDAFDFAQLAEPLKAIKPGSKQAQILTIMLQHVCDCGDFIDSYAQDKSFWTRFLKNLPRQVDGRVEGYRKTLINLRDDFLRYTVVTTEVTALNIEADVGRLSRRLEGISVQFEQVSSQLADLDMNGKIMEIPYGVGSRFRRDKGCLEGTRIDFLDHIINWVNTPGPTRCLVLMGHAGTGKSSIAHEVARRFDDMRRLTSSFVFLRAERSKNDTHLLFTTLARDLSDRYPSYKAALGRAIQNDTALRLGAKDYVTLFESLLRQPLNSLHLFGPVFIIIDGLDECEDASGETGLHTFLADHISTLPPNFRILVTSRPEKDIEQAFSEALSTNLLYMNDTKLSAKARDDIRAYFQKNLPKRVVDQYGDALAEKAEGLFQWASVACGYIRRPPRGLTEGNCIRRLLNPGAEQKRMDPLDDLYRTILSSYFDLDDPDVRQRYQSVMGHLFALFEPLSIDTLTALRQHTQAPDDEDSISAIVGDLGSLLSNVSSSQSSDPIIPLHTSFRDFLTDKSRSDIFYVHLDEAHCQLAHASLGIMLKELHPNMGELDSSHDLNKDIIDLKARVAEHISVALYYACQFWDDHLARARFTDDLFDKLCLLFGNKFLPWLEVLSLTGNMSLASQGLASLQSWLGSSQGNASTEFREFQELVDDAFAFVRYFGMPIAQSAPHIYLSALPFTPSTSRVFKHYAPAYPNILSVKQGRLSRWPVLETVIPTRNERCRAVAYSPDGQRLASGLSDRTICVWSAATGEIVAGPLTAHTHYVSSVAFSPDGQRIASGSHDKKILIWNATTGETVAGPFKEHRGAVTSVTYSPDGQYIASGSGDRTVLVWNAMTGERVAGPFAGHSAWVFSVAFSPDGKRIVSGSGDKTIRVWDATTGEVVAGPFSGHTGGVSSVAFSPDGEHIVSGSESIHVWNATTGETIAGPLPGHTDNVRCVAFSPDGQRIVSGSKDNTVCIWNGITGELIAGPFRGHSEWVVSVTFSPDGQHVASGSFDKTICIWDAATPDVEKEVLPFRGHTDTITTLAYSPDGQHLASGSYDNTIYVWKATTGEVAAGPFIGHTDRINSVSFSPDGRFIVSGSNDKTLFVWDAKTGEKTAGPLSGHTDIIYSVMFSPDSRSIVSSSAGYITHVWDAVTGETVLEPLTGHGGDVFSVVFSPDGQQIASSSTDRTIRLWDAKTGELVGKPLTGHGDTVTCVTFSPDGQRLASGSGDRRIRIWNAKTGEPLAGPFRGHTDCVRSVSFSPDGQHVASGSDDSTVRVWNAITGESVLAPLRGHTSWVSCVTYSPNGQHIASASDRTISVWNAKTGEPVTGELNKHKQAFGSVAFSPDGERIASGSDDYTVCVWSSTTGRMLAGPFRGHRRLVTTVAWSPNGRRIASCSGDRTIYIWDSMIGDIVAGPLGGHQEYVWSVAFSHDGQVVVSGSEDRTIRVWNATTGELIASLLGHSGTIWSVTLSPDGLNIASSSADRTIRIWDAKTGEPIGEPFRGHTGGVSSVVYSPDGRHLASGSYDNSIRVWDPKTGELVAGPFRGHKGDVNEIAYSPDGRFIASASDDRTIGVWHAMTGKRAAGPFHGHTDIAYGVSFSPDGRRIASSGEDATIRVWEFSPPGSAASSGSGSDTQSPTPATDPRKGNDRPPAGHPGHGEHSGDFTDQSLVDDDGWIRGPHGALLIWIPKVHRRGLYRPSNTLVIGENETQLDLDRFVHGKDWASRLMKKL